MNKIQLTYLVNIFIVLFVIFIYYLIIYRPSYKIIKTKIEKEYINDVTLKSYLLENSVSKYIEGAKSISSRSMIRKKIVEYKRKEISLEELIKYTRPKYIDGIKALDDCTSATRFVDQMPIIVYTSLELKNSNICNLEDSVYHQLKAYVQIIDTALVVCVISPIIQNDLVLGYDVLNSSCSKVLKNIKSTRDEFEIFSNTNNVYLSNKGEKVLNYKTDTLVVDKELVHYYVRSEFVDAYYRFSKKKNELFAELTSFRFRQISLMTLLAISIALILFIMQQRAKLIFFKRSRFLKQLVNERTMQLNNSVEELKQTNNSLKDREQQLEESNRTKDKIFSIIAHDLKSPVGVILNFSSFAIEKLEAKDYKAVDEFCKIINSSTKQVIGLLENLLQWARIQSGKMSYTPENVDVVRLIKKTIDLEEGNLKNKSIELTVNTPDKLWVYADNFMLQTIIRNLLANAVKYTNANGFVEIIAKKNSNMVQISVKDNGIGISNENIEKLFKTEYGFSTKGTDGEGGTGLGLVLCKDFVDLNGGEIWVESEENMGTIFSFTVKASE